MLLFGTKFSTFQMVVQVSHPVQSEVSKKRASAINSARIYSSISGICAQVLEGQPGHVHLSLAILQKYCVFGITECLKGKTALTIFEKHGNLKYKFGSKHF